MNAPIWITQQDIEVFKKDFNKNEIRKVYERLIEENRLDFIKLLFENDVKSDDALLLAVKMNKVDIFNYFILQGEKIVKGSYSNETDDELLKVNPVVYCILNNCKDVLDAIASNTNIDDDVNYILFDKIREKNPSLLIHIMGYLSYEKLALLSDFCTMMNDQECLEFIKTNWN